MRITDDDIMLCTNCDAEFTVHRMDDEDDGEEVQFCPYCGEHLWADEVDDDAAIDEDKWND